MERFRPLLPQTTYFLDPLHQFGSPAPPTRKVSVGIDIAQQSAFGDLETESDMLIGKANETASTNHHHEEAKVFGGGHSYIKEWETICQCSDIDEYRAWAFDGELSACRFRSVCWRVFLNIFPPDSSKWLSSVRSKRESYEATRHELIVTPGLTCCETLDPCINNPLSQDEESPWNQYFEDSNLKRLIRLDVQRTFPEVDFFQTKRIQEMLVSILFCYARKYPKISYIQGMHEVLAPIAFVLNYDRHVYAHSDKDEPSSLLQEIMDETYLEHDSYALFESVMEKMHQWYEDGEPKFRLIANRCKTLPTQPFARPQDIGPTTKIVQRLTRVHDHLVKTHEPEIFAHLNRLEIPPQVYGIRWVRLMFGREFSFTDLLMVWDAIFADSYASFLLIEYLVVAMLSYIKDQLLVSDYTSSLSLLMRFPPSSDVQSIIHTALYFRNPKGFTIPAKCGNLPTSLATVGGQPNIHRGPQSVSQSRHGVTRSASLPRPSTAPPSASIKHRSPSVDQQSRSNNGFNRRKSPTVETSCSFSGMTYNATVKPYSDEESKLGENINSTTTRMVSGFARLGGKLSRSRDTTSPNPEILNERPMDELKFIECSQPIPAPRSCEEGDSIHPQPGQSSFTSSSEEEDPSFPQKCVLAPQRVSAEDVLAVGLSCAARLSRYHSELNTRLSQLQIDSDFTIRAAMEGLSEVIETLNNLKTKQKRNSVNRRLSNTMPKSLPVFSHPLMDPENGV